MSRNIKSNLKNPPAKLLLKTIHNPRSNISNEYYLSPYNMKNNSNVSKNILSFYSNESINKSNKKIGNGKINYFYKNYGIKNINKEKERYTHTQTQSKQMSRNNSNKNDLLFNKTTFKNSFSISKTNTNSLMISKKIQKKEKINNKIYKLLLKESSNNTLKKSNIKSKKPNNLSKNKSSNNIHLNRKINLINTLNNNIKTKSNKVNNNNKSNNIKKHIHTKNDLTNKNNNINHILKNKTNNLNLTINHIDKNNPLKILNKILSMNIIKTSKHKNIKHKISQNSFHKTCINSPKETFRKKEQIIKLNKEIENKTLEINNLKNIVNEKDIYIKNLEEKISSLNINQNVDKEYEKYSKIIIVKNIKNLTTENENLHKQILEYKNKETKMMKLLQNMKKSGIDIDAILNQIDQKEEIDVNINSIDSNNSNNSEMINSNKYDDVVLKTDTTNNTNITNNTFLPLNLNEEQKNISHKSCINLEQNLPELPLKNINDYFNENYFAPKGNDNIQIQIINNNDCNILQK